MGFVRRRKVVPYWRVSIRVGGRVLLVAAVACAATASVAGCAKPEADSPRAAPPVATGWPASVSGGACRMLDYAAIEAALKVRFDVAAASERGKTQTCVVRHQEATHPELTFAISATSADASVFKSTVMPSKAKSVSGLGKAAYRALIAAGKKDGPGVEVGWLSGDKRMRSLRFVFPPGTDTAEADALVGPLVEFAKKIDKAKASG